MLWLLTRHLRRVSTRRHGARALPGSATPRQRECVLAGRRGEPRAAGGVGVPRWPGLWQERSDRALTASLPDRRRRRDRSPESCRDRGRTAAVARAGGGALARHDPPIAPPPFLAPASHSPFGWAKSAKMEGFGTRLLTCKISFRGLGGAEDECLLNGYWRLVLVAARACTPHVAPQQPPASAVSKRRTWRTTVRLPVARPPGARLHSVAVRCRLPRRRGLALLSSIRLPSPQPPLARRVLGRPSRHLSHFLTVDNCAGPSSQHPSSHQLRQCPRPRVHPTSASTSTRPKPLSRSRACRARGGALPSSESARMPPPRRR
jgi:hypothetical protein